MANDNLDITLRVRDMASATVNRILSDWKSAVLGVGAAYMGFRAIKDLIGGIITQGMEAEKVWVDVASALAKHGYAVDSNIKKIQEFAARIQDTTSVSDELVGRGIQKLIDGGLELSRAMEAVSVTLDLAAGTGNSVEASFDLLAKAAMGYTAMLSRYGIVLDESIPKQQKFEAALRQIEDRFGGRAQDQLKGWAGQWNLLKEDIGDLAEIIYDKVRPALSMFTGLMSVAVDIGQSLFTDLPRVLGAGFDLLRFEIGMVIKDFQDLWSGLKTAIASMTAFATGNFRIAESFADITDAISEKARADMKTLEEMHQALVKLWEADIAGTTAKQWDNAVNKIAMTYLQLMAATAKTSESVVRGHVVAVEKIYNSSIDILKRLDEDLEAESLRAGEEAFEKLKEGLADRRYIIGLEYDYRIERADGTSKELIRLEKDYRQAIDSLNAQGIRSAEDYARGRETIDRLYALKRKEISERAGNEIINFDEMAFNMISGMASSASNYVVEQLGIMGGKSRSIFEAMAKDFTRLFIDAALKALANFVLKALGILKMFDVAENDKMAFNQGRDFARYFSEGASQGLARANMAANIATAAGGGLRAGAGGGSIIIQNNFQGGMVDEGFIRRSIIPQIERSVDIGRSRLRVR